MARVYRRGKSWYLSWREPGAPNQTRRSLGEISWAEAQALLDAKRIELRTGRNPLALGPTLAGFAAQYLDWHERDHPASHYRIRQIVEQHLVPVFGATPLDGLRRVDVEAYKAGRDAKAGTVNKELRTLQAIVNKALEWELIDRNPIRGVKGLRELDSRPPRWFTVEELAALYTAAPSKGAIWQLMANTGLRRGEMLQLDWRDVGREEIRVVSSSEARTKSGKWRQVPLSPGAQDALERLGRGKGLVLSKMHPRSLSRAFDNDLRRAGDIQGTLHDLRHTFCSHLVMGGIPLRTVQLLAGHSTIRVTERYAHLAPGHLANAVAVLRL